MSGNHLFLFPHNLYWFKFQLQRIIIEQQGAICSAYHNQIFLEKFFTLLELCRFGIICLTTSTVNSLSTSSTWTWNITGQSSIVEPEVKLYIIAITFMLSNNISCTLRYGHRGPVKPIFHIMQGWGGEDRYGKMKPYCL